MEDMGFKSMLLHFFWIASVSLPEMEPESGWLKMNPGAFPELWMSALQSDDILNNKFLIGKWNPRDLV